MNPTLTWSEELTLDLPQMDDTHREFVELLSQAEAADDAGLHDVWVTLVEHTEEHFAREDAWMRETKFSASNCHSVQHRVVLQVIRDGVNLLKQGDAAPVRQMIRELAIWFPQHAQSMDAVLAVHLRRVGYDMETGRIRAPEALPAEEIQGCGGACST